MSPSLKPFIVVFVLGQAALMWWFSGQYTPSSSPAAEPVATTTESETPSAFIWSANEPAGKFWNNKGAVIEREGRGVHGSGKAITIRLEGSDWRGAGLNRKNWNRDQNGTDASGFKSLVFHIRQVTNVGDADLIVKLGDNLKRDQNGATSNDLSILKDGRVSQIDGEWHESCCRLPCSQRTPTWT